MSELETPRQSPVASRKSQVSGEPDDAPSKQKPAAEKVRSNAASEAAKRRWAKDRRAKAQSAAKAKTKKSKKSPREFSSALKTAERRLAMAIQERAEAAAKYAVLSAEIPSLQRIISALQHPAGFSMSALVAPSLEQIVGDALPRSHPYEVVAPARVPDNGPSSPEPPQLPPVNRVNRAQGGAIGVPLEEPEDEDQFLRESPVAGGAWH